MTAAAQSSSNLRLVITLTLSCWITRGKHIPDQETLFKTPVNSKMSLTESPSLSKTATPIKSTVLPSDAYVLSLASLPSHYAASSSASANNIYLFDKFSLRPIGELAGHDRATTCMRSVPKVGDSREVLLSCGRDALVKVWDERSCSVALQSEQEFLR